jgi:hypothetical protein
MTERERIPTNWLFASICDVTSINILRKPSSGAAMKRIRHIVNHGLFLDKNNLFLCRYSALKKMWMTLGASWSESGGNWVITQRFVRKGFIIKRFWSCTIFWLLACRNAHWRTLSKEVKRPEGEADDSLLCSADLRMSEFIPPLVYLHAAMLNKARNNKTSWRGRGTTYGF